MTVYLILHPGDDALKIGHTDGDPLHRVKALQTGSASLLELIGTIPHAPRDVEQQLHQRFAHLRLRSNGEWFTNDPTIHEVFKKYGASLHRTHVQRRLSEISRLLVEVQANDELLETKRLIATLDEIRACVEVPVCDCDKEPSEVVIEETVPDIDYRDSIIKLSVGAGTKHMKSLEDFKGDHASFEFSTIGIIYRYVSFAVADREALRCSYSTSDKAWLLYLSVKEVLPPRDEHREQRNGRPYLLDRALNYVLLSSDTDEEK